VRGGLSVTSCYPDQRNKGTINYRVEDISQGRDRVFGILIDDADEAIAPKV
jgi:hypothetical protein